MIQTRKGFKRTPFIWTKTYVNFQDNPHYHKPTLQALDMKTTQLNQNQISVLVLHLIIHQLTAVLSVIL